MCMERMKIDTSNLVCRRVVALQQIKESGQCHETHFFKIDTPPISGKDKAKRLNLVCIARPSQLVIISIKNR